MLDRNTIIKISEKRAEPQWLTAWRLNAFAVWQNMTEPHWADVDYTPIDYDNLDYFSARPPIDNSDLAAAYDKMGLPESEKNALLGMATDLIIDSRSVNTSYTAELDKLGIIFLPFSEAARKYPELVQRHLGTVVPAGDNFFAALNAAVFSDGTFVYIPKNTKCPIDLASYFRLETAKLGQFERTLIIADENSELSYMEGCSAPRRPNHQLHSGVVEVIAMPGAAVKYATVQNWSRDVYNFVTKRGRVERDAKLYWTQLEMGSGKTWKYPSSILAGENAVSDFYSLSITRGAQQADTGTKMIHLAPNTKSNIVSYGAALDESVQTLRATVVFAPGATGCANSGKCDTRILSENARVCAVPDIRHSSGKNSQGWEAAAGAIDAAALLYLTAGGIGHDEAVALIVAGAAAPVLNRLPMEFLVESKQLIQMALSDE
ncbi:MAG: Fe-S cluster assembly protein SufB [Rickettsiales bacterium]|jgi:Fe-S cluster assembly protein SufB|nr:Fe-S cluster assembly protein SufB [Rickettsiales bacterium]